MIKINNEEVKPYDFIFPTVVGEVELPMVELSDKTIEKFEDEENERKYYTEQIPETEGIEDGFTNIQYNGEVYKCPYEEYDGDTPCPVWADTRDELKRHLVSEHIGKEYMITPLTVNDDGTVEDWEYLAMLNPDGFVRPKDMIGQEEFP